VIKTVCQYAVGAFFLMGATLPVFALLAALVQLLTWSSVFFAQN
jgi:hypothetical protein